MTLILLLCLFSLAVHFVIESMGPANLGSSFPQAGGHYDDHFILRSATLAGSSGLFTKISSEPVPACLVFIQPPLFPPPDSLTI
jgi:hypothetical protein